MQITQADKVLESEKPIDKSSRVTQLPELDTCKGQQKAAVHHPDNIGPQWDIDYEADEEDMECMDEAIDNEICQEGL